MEGHGSSWKVNREKRQYLLSRYMDRPDLWQYFYYYFFWKASLIMEYIKHCIVMYVKYFNCPKITLTKTYLNLEKHLEGVEGPPDIFADK